MSKRLTLDLPDEVYAGLERTAAAQGLHLDEWLCERLQRLVSATPRSDVPADKATPAFWHLPDTDAEEAVLEVEIAAHRQAVRDPEAARSATEAMVRGWFGGPMSEAEAIELAMAEDIHEWNLDQ